MFCLSFDIRSIVCTDIYVHSTEYNTTTIIVTVIEIFEICSVPICELADWSSGSDSNIYWDITIQMESLDQGHASPVSRVIWMQ